LFFLFSIKKKLLLLSLCVTLSHAQDYDDGNDYGEGDGGNVEVLDGDGDEFGADFAESVNQIRIQKPVHTKMSIIKEAVKHR